MDLSTRDLAVTLYSTCPPYRGEAPGDYLRSVRQVAAWSEGGGCDGILVYTDNSLLDPWLVAQVIIEATRSLSPLVAVQPVYMHPYSVAKMVATLSCLYHRRVDLNMVAGGFKNDLQALNDATPHDARYDRLVEYTTIVLGLLAGRAPVTFQGRFHSVTNVTLAPALDPALAPRLTISGSSQAGVAAARALGGLSVKYPAPLAPGAAPPPPDENGYGIRVGIIARPQREEAWATARARFPEDRRGQLTHQLAMKVSDSSWHQQLSDVARTGDGSDTYWMVPFENYKTFCPYLVGTYDAVAEELGRYLATGCRFLILDVPAGAEEFGHINTAIARAAASVGRL